MGGMGTEPALGFPAAMFAAMIAVLGLPFLLSESPRRGRRISTALLLAGLGLYLHGELQRPELLRPAAFLAAALTGALLLSLGLRRWLLRRALLAERPRSPDEWQPSDAPERRLWEGALTAAEPLPPVEGTGPCIYRRAVIERWEAGAWRRVAVEESFAEELSLRGKRRALALVVPRSALRHAAGALGAPRASPSGWRADPDPDPALLYRERVVGLADGARVRLLATAVRATAGGPRLQGVTARAVFFDEARSRALGREAGLCAAAGLVTTLLGLWGAWP